VRRRRHGSLAALLLSALLALHAGSALAGERVAREVSLCGPTAPGVAQCLARRLVPAGAAQIGHGARRYRTAAGAYATGPAGGLTPADLLTAYGLPSGGTAASAGQTVAVVDAYDDPAVASDLATFSTQYGLPACASGCLTVVNQSGGTSLPSPDPSCASSGGNCWAGETVLDVETVHAICPNCKIVLVEASSPTDANLDAAENTAVAKGATEITNSWGAAEGGGIPPADQSAFDHAGVVITASTGDDGYFDWGLSQGDTSPEFPASSPNVIGVGGTSLSLAADGTRSAETVWNDGIGSGGGGCSAVFGRPWWQGSDPEWAATGCGTHRSVGDVSADADPYTGLDVYGSYDVSGSGWVTAGGTSLAAPIIASIFALAGGAQGVSYPAETLYAHQNDSAATLYDVTSGGNGSCGSQSSCAGASTANDCAGTTACHAGPCYDGPSGVGTPIGLGAFAAVPGFTGLTSGRCGAGGAPPGGGSGGSGGSGGGSSSAGIPQPAVPPPAVAQPPVPPQAPNATGVQAVASAAPTLALAVRQSGRAIAVGSLQCPGGCSASAQAVARVAHRARTLGTAHVSVPAGGGGTLRIALSPSGQALLRRRHRLSVTVTVRVSSPAGARTLSRTLLLRG
jgi:hypothetical protein